MRCDNCERIVILSQESEQKLTARERHRQKQAEDRIRFRSFLGDIERFAARRDLEYTDFSERLRRIDFYRPDAGRTIHWLLQHCNPSWWPRLYEYAGFALAESKTAEQWLAHLESGTETAKAFGKRLVEEAVDAWDAFLPEIRCVPESTAGSKGWGRPILMFDLSYTRSRYGVLLTQYLRTIAPESFDSQPELWHE